MKGLRAKVKLRLILVCILLGTIPAIVVGAFSYYKAADMIQKKVDDGNIGVLAQTKMAVEQLLLTSDHIMWQFIQSPAVKEAIGAKMAGSEFGVFSNAEDAINSLPTYDLGISDICLANLDKGWVMDESGIYRLDDYIRKSELDGYLRMPGYSFWVNAVKAWGSGDVGGIPASGETGGIASSGGAGNMTVSGGSTTASNGGGSLSAPGGNAAMTGDAGSATVSGGICLVKKYPLFISNPSIMVVMKIPYSRLNSLISGNKQLGDVMILDRDGSVIAHSNKAMQGGSLSNAEFFTRIEDHRDSKGNFTTEINNMEYSVNYLRSDYNGWIYLSLTSLDYVTMDSKTIGWFTFVTCIIVILFVNLAALIISSRMYRPISKVYNMVMGIQEPDVGARLKDEKRKDELSLIEERVNFLLKDQVRLRNQVYSQYEQLKEFFLLKLILNEMEKEIIDTNVKLYGFPQLPPGLCVLVSRIDTLEGTAYRETDRDLMLFAVNNVIAEILAENIILKPVVADDYQVTILSGGNRPAESLRDFAFCSAEKMQEVVRKELGFTISVGISRTISDYSDIHRGYLDGIEALKQQIILGYNAIIFYQDISGANSLRPIFPGELEHELLEAVKTCDFLKAQELLHRFIERVFKVETGRYECQFYIMRLLTDLATLASETGNSPDIFKQNGRSVFEQLLNLKTAGEIESWLNKAVICRVIECFKNAASGQHKKILEDTLEIIRKEYDTELTLESCAARLNYHPSYIRRILKNEAGISFSEYLAQYRMDMAKKWLLETDIKISDIAEKLMYKNPENFIRSFKKQEGITPGQYREMQMHGGANLGGRKKGGD